jgi:hypothetical protein
MTFAMYASKWKIFFEPIRIRSSCSRQYEDSLDFTHVIGGPMYDLGFQSIIYFLNQSLGDGLHVSDKSFS